MIIFLYGQDSYSSKVYLDKLVAKYKEKYCAQSFVYKSIEAENLSFDDLSSEIFSGAGLFSSNQLFCVKGVFKNKKLAQGIISFLQSHKIDSGLTLIFYEKDGLDGNASAVKDLCEISICRKFPAPSAAIVEKFIVKRAQLLNKKIRQDALEYLSARAGGNLWKAKSQIDKFANLKKDVIDLSDVSQGGGFFSQADIWKFIDSLSSGQKDKALFLLCEAEKEGQDPLYILSMIIRQFRIIISAKDSFDSDSSIASNLGVHPYSVKKAKEFSRKYSFKKLIFVYRLLTRLDSALKRGGGDSRLLFTIFIDSAVAK